MKALVSQILRYYFIVIIVVTLSICVTYAQTLQIKDENQNRALKPIHSFEVMTINKDANESIQLDSFVIEKYDKNLLQWIKSAKFKNGITQTKNDTVWFIAHWVDSTKNWKEYPMATVLYDDYGNLIKKESYDNLVGAEGVVVFAKTEKNYLYNNGNKIETTIQINQDFFTKELINTTKTETTYDEKGNTIGKTLYRWNVDLYKWYGITKDTLGFDEYGNISMTESYRWSEEQVKWLGRDKLEKTFTGFGILKTEVSYSWENSTVGWTKSLKTEITNGVEGELIYTKQYWSAVFNKWENAYQEIKKEGINGLLELYVYLTWEAELNRWSYVNKQENKYDNNMNQILTSRYWWSNDSNRWKGDSKLEKEFAPDNKEISKTEFIWNDTTGTWSYGDREKYSYDEKGNPVLTETLTWNRTLKEWEFKSNIIKSEYKYNASGKIVEKVFSLWNPQKGEWQYTQKDEFDWDNRNLMTLHVNSKWIVESKQWRNFEKIISTYDSEGRSVFIGKYQWNEVKNDWQTTSLNETKFDIFGNSIFNSNVQWFGFGDSYYGFKTESDYNIDNRLNWTCGYKLDFESGKWNKTSKSTLSYYFEELTDTITYYISDATNEWIGDERHINYFSNSPVQEITELNSEDIIKVYPNPAHDFIKIDIGESQNDARFELFDLNGRLMIRKNIKQSSKVELQNLKSGIYPWKITLNDKSLIGKVVISQ